MKNTLEMLKALNKHLHSLCRNPAERSAGVLCHRQNLLCAQHSEAGLGATQVFQRSLNSLGFVLRARFRKITAVPGVCSTELQPTALGQSPGPQPHPRKH